MRKLLPIQIDFAYEESKDNEEIIQRIYNRIFEMAKQNVFIKQNKMRREVENKIYEEKVSSIR